MDIPYLDTREYSVVLHQFFEILSVRFINRSTDVGVSRTDLSLDNYHCQVMILVKQITVELLLLDRLKL